MPMIDPSTPVSTPVMRSRSGNGIDHSCSIRNDIQAPLTTNTIWHSENMPTRPTSRPRPRVTAE